VTVIVNGEPCDLAPGTTVAELLAAQGAGGRGCAVAVDGSVVPRGSWAAEQLRDGQQVELVRATQGG
jgi:sulfur carrier protein